MRVAKEDITGDTELTNDLIAEKFTESELPKEYAEEAISDLTAAPDQVPLARHRARASG